MSKGLLRGLALAAVAALGAMTCVASAGAATEITSCTTLGTFGATYVLTADLTPDCAPCLGLTEGPATDCGACLVVANDRITIDLAGHTITGSCAGGSGVTDGGTPRQLTTVKNGAIQEFDFGISLGASTRTVIRNLEVSDNAVHGLLLGPRSLVKGCLIERNGQDGIIIGEFGQVQDCTIRGHAPPDAGGGIGIFSANRALITNNTVEGTLSGIVVGEFSTVSFNTSSGNAFFGVLGGAHSLVTRNETNGNGTSGISTSGLSSVSGNLSNDNGGVGIETSCPSTVTNNKSSGNGLSNYTFIGPRCQANNNK